MKEYILATAILAAPGLASATTVDLTGWKENGFQGNNGAGTWTVQGADSDNVVQSINGAPTVFFDDGTNAQGTALGGEITVETYGDDDYIGFVLGYEDGEFNSTNADFWLIDWKQGNQSYLGRNALSGLALSHVTGDLSTGDVLDFWDHTVNVNEKARATNLGNTGWNDLQKYEFKLIFTDSLIEVIVDGVEEISFAGNFTDGAFGFYNYSQNAVRYAGITESVVVDPNVVPLPAGMPLMLAGLGAFAFMRRRKAQM